MRSRIGMPSILRGRPEGRTAPRRPDRRGALTLETLEGRIVLSALGSGVPHPAAALPGGSGGTTTGSGGTMCPAPSPPSGGSGGTSTGQQAPPPAPPAPVGLGPSLIFLGVIPAGPGAPPPPPAGSSTQLAKDVQKLNTDVSGFLAKSSVTNAELSALNADDQAIVAAKVKLDPKAVTAAESDLANAIAGGTYTAKAAALQAEFAALFTGSPLTKAAIAKAFGDVVAIVQSSHATAAYLQTIDADQAAILADQAAKKKS